MKKALSLLMGCTVIAGSLVGCSGGEKTQPQATQTTGENTEVSEKKDPVKLVFWNGGLTDMDDSGTYSKEELPFYKTLERFKEANPHVEVEIVRYNVDQLTQLLTASSMSGELPDVIATWAGSYTNNFQNILQPLEEYMTPEEIDKYAGLDICRVDMQPDGALQALPLGLTTYNIYYNKEVFAGAGIDEANLPQTWDEYLALCETLKTAGVTPIVTESGGGVEAWMMAEFLADELGSENITKIGNGEIKFEDELFQRCYNEWKKVFDLGYVNEDFKSIDGGKVMQYFTTGEAAMMYGGSWNQKDLYETMGDNVGTFKIPALSADSPYKDNIISQPGMNIAVTNTSKYKEEAVEFIKTFSDATYQAEDCMIFGNVPSHKDADMSSAENTLTQISAEWIKSSPTVIGFDSLIPADAANEFYKNCVLVNTDRLSIQEFGKMLDDIITSKN